ncbi:unnamed protein product [Plutella xylostella]|uniref:(diamondback moth) hypothetical protein n=1 Tax=Plutella xylostella TaxID=51655 RepID=A0A8S4GHH5_PLUXY|nr:unnamed protein product [Plutella xylostella]
MFLFISILLPCVLALPDPGTKDSEVPKLRNKTDPARSVWKDCANGIFNPSCVKISAITLLEGLNNKDEIHLLPGVSVVKESSATEAPEDMLAFAKSLPVEDKLDKFFIYRLGNYLDTHSLRLKLVDDNVMREARSMVGEARRKDPLGGKKGGLGVILAMAMMMKGMLLFRLEPFY